MKIVWVAVAAALASAPAYAEDFGVPMNVPSGSIIDLTIEKQGEITEQGVTSTMDFTFRYRQELVATEAGYTVTQTALDMQGPDEAREAMDAAMIATRKITYDTSEDLTPTSIRDVDTLLSDIMKPLAASVPATPEQLEAQKRTVAMFKRMSPEQLATVLLKEQATVAAYQGVVLPVGETVEAEADLPHPLAPGATVKQLVRASLTSVDDSRGIAIIETSDSLDPDSVRAVIPDVYRQMAPDAKPPSAEELAALTVEQSVACRYEIDLETGLASVTQCTETKSTGGKRAVTRMRITQKLTRP